MFSNSSNSSAFAKRVMRGLIAAPYTPFDRESGDLNLSAIEPYAESLVSAGVTGAFVCGTTGEGISLTLDERMSVAKRWVEVAGSKLNVIVHVGDLSQRNAIALAAHARQIRAAGVAAMPAFFFKPTGTASVVEFCKPIAAAAGELPFYYYHIPSMTGVVVSILELIELSAARIPNFRGVKYTHGDMMEFTRCLRAFGDSHELAWGVDEMLLGALALGAQAAVGSTYNYAGGLYQKLIRAHQAGDGEKARDLAAQSCEMISVLIRHGVLRTGKATMAMIGIDCGTPRSPISPLTSDELSKIKADYEQIDAFPMGGVAQRSVSTSSKLPTAT